jgi:hypothetical protein
MISITAVLVFLLVDSDGFQRQMPIGSFQIELVSLQKMYGRVGGHVNPRERVIITLNSCDVIHH